jgi:hypothetical protein
VEIVWWDLDSWRSTAPPLSVLRMANTPPNQQLGHDDDDHVIPGAPIPADELPRYSVDRDPDSEKDIKRYVELEARGETVQHAEKVKTEIVLGDKYDMWDVTTDKNRWWLITNLTNLYPKDHFQSLDYTLSFHVGLMMRMRSHQRPSNEPTPFDEVFRRQAQAHARLDEAVEVEDLQAVGMVLRECLLSLLAAVRRRVVLPADAYRPQDANFIEWSALLLDQLCPGGSNKELRSHLKNAAASTWQLVGWLTHARSATATAAIIAAQTCDTLVGDFISLVERERLDRTDKCPACKSRDVRSHFDPAIGLDGDYYQTCGACRWSSHPGAQEDVEEKDGTAQ